MKNISLCYSHVYQGLQNAFIQKTELKVGNYVIYDQKQFCQTSCRSTYFSDHYIAHSYKTTRAGTTLSLKSNQMNSFLSIYISFQIISNELVL